MATLRPPRGPDKVLLVRHAATAWSRSGRHTGRTDLPLDDGGTADAVAIGERLKGQVFAAVWSSPLARAVETCVLAGLGSQMRLVDDLAEWDYGDYEGLTTAQIRRLRPGWELFADGCPGGEDARTVGARVDRVIEAVFADEDLEGGTVALFSHGHLLRTLTARWLGLDAPAGRCFHLDTGRLSALGWGRDGRELLSWNC
jgi:broad specificity phosphatase PhoE